MLSVLRYIYILYVQFVEPFFIYLWSSHVLLDSQIPIFVHLILIVSLKSSQRRDNLNCSLLTLRYCLSMFDVVASWKERLSLLVILRIKWTTQGVDRFIGLWATLWGLRKEKQDFVCQSHGRAADPDTYRILLWGETAVWMFLSTRFG